MFEKNEVVVVGGKKYALLEKDGNWVPDDVQGCAFADENGNLVGVMHWDEQRQVIQIVEDDSLVEM